MRTFGTTFSAVNIEQNSTKPTHASQAEARIIISSYVIRACSIAYQYTNSNTYDHLAKLAKRPKFIVIVAYVDVDNSGVYSFRHHA